MIVPDGETAAYARSHGSPGSGPLVGKRTLVTGASRPSALPWPWHMPPREPAFAWPVAARAHLRRSPPTSALSVASPTQLSRTSTRQLA